MGRLFTRFVVSSAVLVAGLLALGGHASAAQSGCDSFAIMKCGASSPQEFIQKAKTNDAGDLKAIYADFGLVPADYTNFANNAKMGTVHNDGRIVVDGVTVGHSTLNVGRVHDGDFNQAVKINGHTYWGGPFGSTFHADTAQAMVWFNDKGVMQFAVLTSCGNPQRIVANKPQFSCDLLQKQAVSGTPNRYSFTTKATASQGATVSKVVYDFGDGTTAQTGSLSQAVEHTFTKSSTVKVTVFVTLPGGGTKSVTSVNCETQITVTPPPQPPKQSQAFCESLKADLIDSDNRQFRFTATAVTSGGATLTGGTFNLGDGTPLVMASPSGNNTVVIQHNFAQAGNFTATATLHFTDANGKAVDSDCSAQVSPTTVTKAVALVNTGPGPTLAGIFGGAGTLAGIGHYLIRRRHLGR